VRFCLVDRIVEMDAGESITALKNLTSAEEYLADHFPGFPIMPGVLMVESLVQTGAWLMRFTENFAYSTILLKEVRAVKFSNFVKPGETLRIHCKVHGRTENEYVLKATGTVNDRQTATARLTLTQFNLSDRAPEMAGGDRKTIERQRELFDQIWCPTADLATMGTTPR
jgi:3-hydroxyacyl-[acyl-carrier-protein] dehydratase